MQLLNFKFLLATFMILILGLEVSATKYILTFSTFSDAVRCLSRDVLYIQKVSSNVSINQNFLNVETTGVCQDNILTNLKEVCTGWSNATCKTATTTY